MAAFGFVTNLLNVSKIPKKARKLFVSMSGIGPLSKAYESFVLPLNYTDGIEKYSKNSSQKLISHRLVLNLVAEVGIAPTTFRL